MPSRMQSFDRLLLSFLTFIVSISFVYSFTLAPMLYSLVRVTRRDRKGKLKSMLPLTEQQKKEMQWKANYKPWNENNLLRVYLHSKSIFTFPTIIPSPFFLLLYLYFYNQSNKENKWTLSSLILFSFRLLSYLTLYQ